MHQGYTWPERIWYLDAKQKEATCIKLGGVWIIAGLWMICTIASSIQDIARIIFTEHFISKQMCQASMWQFHLICNGERKDNVQRNEN